MDVSVRMYRKCKKVLEEIALRDRQYVINGTRNIWILKPSAKSRGRGIQVCDKLFVCLQQLENGGSMIIQKYIGVC